MHGWCEPSPRGDGRECSATTQERAPQHAHSHALLPPPLPPPLPLPLPLR